MASSGQSDNPTRHLLLPNDMRISCKRPARESIFYVSPPAIGGWRRTELNSDPLVGCMRGSGGDPCEERFVRYPPAPVYRDGGAFREEGGVWRATQEVGERAAVQSSRIAV